MVGCHGTCTATLVFIKSIVKLKWGLAGVTFWQERPKLCLHQMRKTGGKTLKKTLLSCTRNLPRSLMNLLLVFQPIANCFYKSCHSSWRCVSLLSASPNPRTSHHSLLRDH